MEYLWKKNMEGGNRQRQRIGLSNDAYQVIMNDIYNFLGEKAEVSVTKNGKPIKSPNFSHLINAIIVNYYEQSSASISQMLFKKRTELEHDLVKLSHYPAIDDVFESILEQEKNRLSNRFSTFPKDKSITILLSKKNYELFFLSDCEEGYYYATQNQYFKALLEDYAQLPVHKREEIYFGDILSVLQKNKRKKQLLIQTVSSDAKMDATNSLPGNQKYECRLYDCIHSYMTGYYYLIVYRRPYRSHEEWKLASMRLSRISKCEVIQNGQGMLTKVENKRIKKRLQETDVAYLQGEAQEILVRLSNNGEILYKQIQHLRPALTATSQPHTYTVHCTPRQASNYFMSFAEHAEIISPQQLRNEMALRFANAYSIYENH